MYLRFQLNNNAMKNRTHTVGVFLCLLICSCNNNGNITSNINTKASIPDSFEFSPAGLKVITTFISKKPGTMSTLYGNPLAVKSAGNFNKALAGGESFTLVTWKQQPDEHWFGANIPGDLQLVEVLTTNLSDAHVMMNYQRYEGKKLDLLSDTLYKRERIKLILDQRPSVMP